MIVEQHWAKGGMSFECLCGFRCEDMKIWMEHIQNSKYHSAEEPSSIGLLVSFVARCSCGKEINDLGLWLKHIHPKYENGQP